MIYRFGYSQGFSCWCPYLALLNNCMLIEVLMLLYLWLSDILFLVRYFRKVLC